MIGEPDAGKPHVRFDEGAQETCGIAARLCPTLHALACPVFHGFQQTRFRCAFGGANHQPESGPLSRPPGMGGWKAQRYAAEGRARHLEGVESIGGLLSCLAA